MGRFETTVPLYAELRPPYPDRFFRTVAAKLGLSQQDALIDLGTGPGLLALGFAPYVGRITGVDPEPAMLAVARQAAERQSRAFTLIEGKGRSAAGGYRQVRGRDNRPRAALDGSRHDGRAAPAARHP
jgi:SAM-dependent methyltransferase